MAETTIPENPAAFPDSVSVDHMDGLNFSRNKGMNLSDYFAARVMATMSPADWPPESIARYAYSVANAMLRERAKGGK